jgi:hypothetical protein
MKGKRFIILPTLPVDLSWIMEKPVFEKNINFTITAMKYISYQSEDDTILLIKTLICLNVP